MTSRELLIYICEKWGFEDVQEYPSSSNLGIHGTGLVGKYKGEYVSLPYLDFNFMHTVEKMLNEEQSAKYEDYLLRVCNKEGRKVWHATEIQRARGFYYATKD